MDYREENGYDNSVEESYEGSSDNWGWSLRKKKTPTVVKASPSRRVGMWGRLANRAMALQKAQQAKPSPTIQRGGWKSLWKKRKGWASKGMGKMCKCGVKKTKGGRVTSRRFLFKKNHNNPWRRRINRRWFNHFGFVEEPQNNWGWFKRKMSKLRNWGRERAVQLSQNVKKFGGHVKRGVRAVGQAAKYVGSKYVQALKHVGKKLAQAGKWIARKVIGNAMLLPLLPMLPIMKWALNKRKLDSGGDLFDITLRFYNRIVRGKNSYEEPDRNNIGPLYAKIIPIILKYAYKVYKEKNNPNATPEEKEMGEKVGGVMNQIVAKQKEALNIKDPNAIIPEVMRVVSDRHTKEIKKVDRVNPKRVKKARIRGTQQIVTVVRPPNYKEEGGQQVLPSEGGSGSGSGGGGGFSMSPKTMLMIGGGVAALLVIVMIAKR